MPSNNRASQEKSNCDRPFKPVMQSVPDFPILSKSEIEKFFVSTQRVNGFEMKKADQNDRLKVTPTGIEPVPRP